MPPRSRYLRAQQALQKELSGESLTRTESLALRTLEERLGLSRPLSSYAPRTRRRYIAAARAGQTATEANRREYRARAITGEARTARIEELRQRLDNSSLDRISHSPEQIADLVDTYGEPFVLQVLTDQLRSVEAYQSGDPGPGRARWANRQAIVERYRTSMELDESTDPYFYYHGTLS